MAAAGGLGPPPPGWPKPNLDGPRCGGIGRLGRRAGSPGRRSPVVADLRRRSGAASAIAGKHAEDTVPGLRISDTARTAQPSIFETEMPVIDCAKLLPIYILLSGLLLKSQRRFCSWPRSRQERAPRAGFDLCPFTAATQCPAEAATARRALLLSPSPALCWGTLGTAACFLLHFPCRH